MFYFPKRGLLRVLQNHRSRLQTRLWAKEWRKSFIQLWIDEPFNSPFGYIREFRDANFQKIHRKGNRLSMEIPS